MNWNKTHNSDDRAVSPVIGVIMMVAVTVILAAVVSTLVLGMGDDLEANPQANFGFDYDATGTNLTITHEGGQTLEAAQVYVNNGTEVPWASTGDISAGDSMDLTVSPDDTVRVVWKSDNGNTAILATYKVPA